MFLTERSVNNTFNLNDLISESYENILEFDNQYHELCMKMIKVEHMALVQGNTSMLHEAEETFKTRLKNFLKTLWEKLKGLIDKAVSFITGIYAKATKKFFLKQKVYNDLVNAKNFAINDAKKAIVISKKVFNALKNVNILNDSLEKIEKMLDKDDVEDTTLKEQYEILAKFKEDNGNSKDKLKLTNSKYIKDAVDGALLTIKSSNTWIKILKSLRGITARTYTKDIKGIDSGNVTSEDKLHLVEHQRFCTKMMTSINFMLANSVKILNRVVYIAMYKGGAVSSNNKERQKERTHGNGLTNAFYNAVDSGNLRMVRIMMNNSLLYEPTFKEFESMNEYASKYLEDLYDEHDGKKMPTESEFSDDEMNSEMVNVIYNFSHERIACIKKLVTWHMKNLEKKKKEIFNKLKDKNGRYDRGGVVSHICSNELKYSDVKELCSDPDFEKVRIGENYPEKVEDRHKWNKAYLDKIRGLYNEVFNRDYLLHLSDVAYYLDL